MNNREDEVIREALKLDITVPDGLNSRILRAVDRKKRSSAFMRTAVTAAVCFLIFLGMGAIVKATSGVAITELMKEKIENWSYVYENGSDVKREIVREDGEVFEEITFVKEKVVVRHAISDEETNYWLCLKVTDAKGYNYFIELDAAVDKTAPLRDLYYAIRGGFRSLLEYHHGANEKRQILEGLREAAEHTQMTVVRNALLDLASDYENDRRIYYEYLPGKYWGVGGEVIYFEDLSDLPTGDSYIIIDPVNDKQLPFICSVHIEDGRQIVLFTTAEVYSEENLKEAEESGLPVYDLRRDK